jgi:hypothetical protein
VSLTFWRAVLLELSFALRYCRSTLFWLPKTAGFDAKAARQAGPSLKMSRHKNKGVARHNSLRPCLARRLLDITILQRKNASTVAENALSMGFSKHSGRNEGFNFT